MGVYTTMRASGMSATARLVERRRSSPASGCRKCLVRDPGLATSWRVHRWANAGLASLSRWMKRVQAGSPRCCPNDAACSGVVGALLLTRTVRAATRTAPTG